MYIDTHAHILSSFYNDLPVAVQAIMQSQTTCVINIGTNMEENEEVISLQTQYPTLFKSSVGLHPEIAATKTEDTLHQDVKNLRALVEKHHNELSAIGEFGLDYKWLEEGKERETKEKQRYLLEEQLQIAETFHLPIVIHCREALSDFYAHLIQRGKKGYKGVLHSIDGDLPVINDLIKLGFFVSFNGIMTFKNATHIQNLAKEIPLEKILLETDSPFLTPTPLRGEKNSPINMKYIYAFLAQIKNISVEKIVEQVNMNASIMFGI